jgi:PTH1 family peptidyl-tRNA hydrolase
MSVKLFVGLGNPGDKYKNTRHNFGFMVLDSIAKKNSLEFKNWNNMADISFYRPAELEQIVNIYLLKPMTYMNNSGEPIAAFAKYYKIDIKDIFVFYDELSINLGDFRIKLSGSSAGHNGIKSIIKHFNSENFPRMKLGIGVSSLSSSEKVDFVLSQFDASDKEKIAPIIDKAIEFFESVCLLGLEKAVSKLN